MSISITFSTMLRRLTTSYSLTSIQMGTNNYYDNDDNDNNDDDDDNDDDDIPNINFI